MAFIIDADVTEEPLGTSVGLPNDPLEMAAIAKQLANAAEISALLHTLDWAHGHGTDAETRAASLDRMHPIPLAGDGTPWVREEAIPELANLLGMSDHAARLWIGDALELTHRLPHLFERLFDQQLPLWKARMVAQASRPLTPEGAAWLDKELAHRFEKVGPTALKRFIDEAITRFDPDLAQQRATAAAEVRKVGIYPDETGTGVTDIVAAADDADAKDLEAALQKAAAELAEQGSDDSLDVRRARALGHIARTYLVGTTSGTARQVSLYVHLREGDQLATVEGMNGHRTLSQIRDWCQSSNTKVVLRPVLDLNRHLRRSSYAPSEEMREQAILTDQTCVAPHCTRNARTADLDHIEPWPHGPTESDNLACLCRYHHRIKTFTDWTYTKIEPGYYLWRSPQGRHYLRTPSGTIKLE